MLRNIEVLSVDVNLFLSPDMNAGVSLVKCNREIKEREDQAAKR